MLEIGANGPLDKLIGLLKELKGPLEGHSDGLLEELNGLMNGAKLGLVKDEDNGFTKGTKLGLLSHELKGFTKGAELGLILGLLIDANGLELGNWLLGLVKKLKGPEMGAKLGLLKGALLGLDKGIKLGLLKGANEGLLKGALKGLMLGLLKGALLGLELGKDQFRGAPLLGLLIGAKLGLLNGADSGLDKGAKEGLLKGAKLGLLKGALLGFKLGLVIKLLSKVSGLEVNREDGINKLELDVKSQLDNPLESNGNADKDNGANDEEGNEDNPSKVDNGANDNGSDDSGNKLNAGRSDEGNKLIDNEVELFSSGRDIANGVESDNDSNGNPNELNDNNESINPLESNGIDQELGEDKEDGISDKADKDKVAADDKRIGAENKDPNKGGISDKLIVADNGSKLAKEGNKENNGLVDSANIDKGSRELNPNNEFINPLDSKGRDRGVNNEDIEKGSDNKPVETDDNVSKDTRGEDDRELNSEGISNKLIAAGIELINNNDKGKALLDNGSNKDEGKNNVELSAANELNRVLGNKVNDNNEETADNVSNNDDVKSRLDPEESISGAENKDNNKGIEDKLNGIELDKPLTNKGNAILMERGKSKVGNKELAANEILFIDNGNSTGMADNDGEKKTVKADNDDKTVDNSADDVGKEADTNEEG